MRIGSRKYALALAKHFDRLNWDRYENEDTCPDGPDGFKPLGSGCSRDVYLGPDGVVYKYGSEFDNLSEALNYREMAAEVPSGWALAPSTYYACGVLAMEFIDGLIDAEYHDDIDDCNCTGKCVRDIIWELSNKTGLYDIHDENYFINDEGVRVLIDYAR